MESIFQIIIAWKDHNTKLPRPRLLYNCTLITEFFIVSRLVIPIPRLKCRTTIKRTGSKNIWHILCLWVQLTRKYISQWYRAAKFSCSCYLLITVHHDWACMPKKSDQQFFTPDIIRVRKFFTNLIQPCHLLWAILLYLETWDFVHIKQEPSISCISHHFIYSRATHIIIILIHNC